MNEHARKRDPESIARNRARVEELQEIAGSGSFDQRVHNLARYFERVYFGAPKPVRKWKRSAARPPRENVIQFRRRVEPPKPTQPAPKRHRGRRPHPKVTGWWLRCETCRRYVGRDGSCIHCDNPREVSD